MIRFLVFFLILAGLAPAARLRLDTSVLDPSQTWYLDFQLVDGDGVDNNTVNIDSTTLTNDQFFAQSLNSFVPALELILNINWTSNFSGVGFADTFTWAVLDANFNPIVADGLGASLVVLLDGSGPQVFAATADYNNVTPEFLTENAIPEPATLWLVALSGSLLLATQRARRSGHSG
jgi:hypothetical protein